MRVYRCRTCRYPVAWCADDVALDADALGHFWTDGTYHRDAFETVLPAVLPPQAWDGIRRALARHLGVPESNVPDAIEGPTEAAIDMIRG